MTRDDVVNELRNTLLKASQSGHFEIAYILNTVCVLVLKGEVEGGNFELLERLQDYCGQVLECDPEIKQIIKPEKDREPKVSPLNQIIFLLSKPPEGPKGFM